MSDVIDNWHGRFNVRLFAYAKKLTKKNFEKAADLVMQTWSWAWQNLSQFTGDREGDEPLYWMMAKLYRLYLDDYRATVRRNRVAQELYDQRGARSVEHMESREEPDPSDILLCTSMPEGIMLTVEVLMRHTDRELCFDEASTAELAEDMGCSVEMMRRRLRLLRKWIDENGEKKFAQFFASWRKHVHDLARSIWNQLDNEENEEFRIRQTARIVHYALWSEYHNVFAIYPNGECGRYTE